MKFNLNQLLRLFGLGLIASTPVSLLAQVPDIPYKASDALSGFPSDIYLGEAAGVARNSAGEIFVYTRTGNPTITLGTSRAVSHGGARLFQFDANGFYMREIGQDTYGALYAQQVRVDSEDNIWTVDQMSGQVIRFNPAGQITMVMSRKPEAMPVPERPFTEPANNGVGREGESFQGPTDVTWDSDGNFYVADGIRNARIAKYDPNGKWVMNWGSYGSGQGQFNVVHGIAIDRNDNLYVADYNNERIEVFDTMGNFKRQLTGFGHPMAICITPGPNQVMYVSNSNAPDNLDVGGEIYKMRLDGTIIGKFGTAGKKIGDFGTVNAIDCQQENNLLVGELGNWRVQRVELQH
ncbi:MAG: 6-bladed beta-propeller [Gammaproteobacteria bacterium]|nr:hypothetical protein [Pseudomonadales bacterium]MCP5348581.1 hypothetical protein [Pseudomonadales bacterium]